LYPYAPPGCSSMLRAKQVTLCLAAVLCTIAILAVVYLVTVRSHVPGQLRSQQVDLGRVRANSMIRPVLRVTHDSQGVVRVSKVSTSCSCTVARALPKTLSPGRTYEMPVEINVIEMEGRVAWVFAIVYDGGRTASYTVYATVFRGCPSAVFFPEYKRGEKGRLQFPVYSVDGAPISIRRVEHDLAYFSVTWENGRVHPAEAIVTVVQRESIPYGAFQKDLVVVTDEQGDSGRLVDVRGRVTRPLVVEPRQLSYGLLGEKERASKLVRLTSPYGGALRFLRYEAEPSGLVTVKAEDVKEENGNLIVPVEIAVPRSGDVVNGRIRFIVSVDGREEGEEILFFAATK